MTRNEKIEIIKKVKAGDFELLNNIRKEKEKNRLLNDNFYACFYYLFEHGRIDNNHIYLGNNEDGTWGERPFITLQDMIYCIDNLKKAAVDNMKYDFSLVTLKSMKILMEVIHSIKFLIERNEIHLLEPYKMKVDKNICPRMYFGVEKEGRAD